MDRKTGKLFPSQYVFPILDMLPGCGDIRDQSLKWSKIDRNFACFWPPNFFGGEPPKFLKSIYSIPPVFDHVAKFSPHLFFFALRPYQYHSSPAEGFRAHCFQCAVLVSRQGLHSAPSYRSYQSSMNCVTSLKWRMSRLVSDSVLPHLHH